LRKRGRTAATQNANGADWRASDEIQYGTRGMFGWSSWRRIGDETSTANATEFDSDYSGVPAYYNVSGSPSDRSLRIAAIATKREAQIRTADLLGIRSGSPIAVAAIARVEYRRPRGDAFAALGSNRREYAHLFNPLWEAKLAPFELDSAR
jgi:hypothetical protein